MHAQNDEPARVARIGPLFSPGEQAQKQHHYRSPGDGEDARYRRSPRDTARRVSSNDVGRQARRIVDKERGRRQDIVQLPPSQKYLLKVERGAAKSLILGAETPKREKGIYNSLDHSQPFDDSWYLSRIFLFPPFERKAPGHGITVRFKASR